MLVDQIKAFVSELAVEVSLHSANPGPTGENELAGGTPPYARRPAVWSETETGTLRIDDLPVFDVPSGSDVSYVGLWSGDGEFLKSAATPEVERFVGQGVYVLTSTTFTVDA